MAETTIDRLGRQGDGISGELRVPFTLPGELVRVESPDHPETVEIVTASPARVVPVCPHFGVCGGCTLQHASDPFLETWKTDIVERALAARGLEALIRPTAVSPPNSRRRALFAGTRTRKTVLIGFHKRRSEEVVDITGCDVLRTEILSALPALRALVGLGASRSAGVRLAVTCGPSGLDVSVMDAKPLDADLRANLAGLAESHDLARLTWDGELVAFRRPPLQPMGSAQVTPPPGAFLQATVDGEAALVGAVCEAVDSATRIADLFSGCGTFALPLAESAEVHAVEGASDMLEALDAGWRRASGLRRVSTEQRDLMRRPLLAEELNAFGAVVIDPPRAGAEAQARALASSSVARVASVSCDPATFARDAAILVAGGFRLDWVQPVDQFRWTGHIEIAAQFTR